jgi:hypothetical protein
MRKIHIYIVLVVFGLISAVLPAAPAAAQASGDPPGLVVSEVQTTGLDATGVEVGTKEFVEVYNPSDLPLTATACQILPVFQLRRLLDRCGRLFWDGQYGHLGLVG